MSNYKPLDDRQVINRAALSNIGTPANESLDVILAAINSALSSISGGQGYIAKEVALTSGTTSYAVIIPTQPDTSYVAYAIMENLVDSNPQYQQVLICNKTTTGFTVEWNTPLSSNNYKLSYIIPYKVFPEGETSVSSAATNGDVIFTIPQTGATLTNWQSYIPTGSWVANTSYSGYWRRVGSDMEIWISVSTSGTPTPNILTINIPSQYTINTTIFPTGTPCGIARPVSATPTSYNGEVVVNSTNTIVIDVDVITTFSGTQYPFSAPISSSSNSPFTWAPGDYISLYCKVPIAGWTNSSNYGLIASMENYTDTYPQFQPILLTEQDANQFYASWNAPTFTANNVISYMAKASGVMPISLGSTTVTLNLPVNYGTSSYGIMAVMGNTTDSNPQYQPILVENKTQQTAILSWNVPTETSNYFVYYYVISLTP